ncbi:hypothetical protein [Aeromicrobium sp. Root495]|uniref:hypothetical protein n=1 Tax=Aeromicrobium sp. Root495 TaxID=1736550 RepID=UPI000AC0BE45|nr:hypothetical protein [Aeromicrobium sp. Root495]
MTVLRAADAAAQSSRSSVRHAIASGRWQRPARGVVVTHNGPLDAAERRWVSLLRCPPRSVLAGATALELAGLRGFESDLTFVAIPEGADRPSADGLVTHWSTQLDYRDVHPAREPARTRPARSLIDFSSWCGNQRYARAAVIAAFQQRLVTATQMHEALDRRGLPKRKGIVRESVLDAEGGIQSLPEADFDSLVVVAGLPRPTRQRRVRGADGTYYLDASWDQYGVAVEIHGLPHHGIISWSDDLLRANEIVIDGPRLLIFTSYAVPHEPAVVLDQLVRALRAAGWKGFPKPLDPVALRRRTMRG